MLVHKRKTGFWWCIFWHWTPLDPLYFSCPTLPHVNPDILTYSVQRVLSFYTVHEVLTANILRWWSTGKPGVLWSMGSQGIGHDWVTEQQQNKGSWEQFLTSRSKLKGGSCLSEFLFNVSCYLRMTLRVRRDPGVSMGPELRRTSLVAQMVKNSPAVQETWVRSVGWEDPLEKGMAAHSSILAWRIPGTEESDRLHSMGSQQ